MPHPAYSPDLAPSDFDLFGKLRNSLRGEHLKMMKCHSMRCSADDLGKSGSFLSGEVPEERFSILGENNRLHDVTLCDSYVGQGLREALTAQRINNIVCLVVAGIYELGRQRRWRCPDVRRRPFPVESGMPLGPKIFLIAVVQPTPR
ncbi:SETMAR [Cordylochernes scorpioides]|uniref:SETMAR n=1 Tax=Cordylochernes scorpioides TaxID=51811 RepID=A0ABY6KLF4_9ARAC|nr:SETMAR [Cordylochernes scorpioides]